MLLSLVVGSGFIYANDMNGTTKNLKNTEDLSVGSIQSNESLNDNERENNSNHINDVKYDLVDDVKTYSVVNKKTIEYNNSTDNETIIDDNDLSDNEATVDVEENNIEIDKNNKNNLNNDTISGEAFNKTDSNYLSSNMTYINGNNYSFGENNMIFAAGDSASFSKSSIYSSSSAVKNYVLTNNKLPNYVTISNQKVSMNEFLYLLSKTIVNENKGLNLNITRINIKDPSNPSGNSINGKLYKNEYFNLAQRIVSYMEKNNQAPNYGTSTIGNIQYQTIIYGFSRILDFTKTNKILPNYLSLNIKSSADLNKVIPRYEESSAGSSSSNTGSSISLANIKDAGARIEAFITQYGKLPNYVTISGKQYSMAQFLYLASKAIVNIDKGTSSAIVSRSVKDPSNPTGVSINGNIYKADFISLSSRVSTYITQNGQAPNYGNSNLGKIQFQTLVFGLSKILLFSKNNNRLPNYLTLNVPIGNSLNGVQSKSMNDQYNGESLEQYLKASKNCEVDDSTLKSLAISITKNCNSELQKATSIYNWMRSNIDYSFYYNTKYGAKKTISMKSGNCVDQSHLLIALCRANGLAARYVHGTATFTSGSTYGHVWVQIKIGNTWTVADTTNSKNSLGIINSWNTKTVSIIGKYASISF